VNSKQLKGSGKLSKFGGSEVVLHAPALAWLTQHCDWTLITRVDDQHCAPHHDAAVLIAASLTKL
jgi:hypothetical protein